MILAFITYSLSLESCKDEKNSAEATMETLKEVAIEISQEKIVTQYAQTILDSSNDEFVQGNEVQKILSKQTKMRAISMSESDTITQSEEIPITKSFTIQELIYTDGKCFYQSIDNTASDMKLIETLNVNKQPENEIVVKTEMKDNVVYLYNSNGEVIKTQPVGNMDLKPMIDSLTNYLAEQESSRQNIKAIRSNVAIQKAISKGMRVVSQNNSEIIMEIDIQIPSESSTNRVKTSVYRKAVMSFTPDMKSMNYQKIYNNNQLVNQIIYDYAENSEKGFQNDLTGFNSENLPNSNVKKVLNKKLAFRIDGSPYIQNIVEVYKKNSVKLNLKK